MTTKLSERADLVELGHVSGVHGLRGWIKVFSLTDPREAIFDYQPWLLGEQRQAVNIAEGRRQGKFMVARLEQVETREQAQSLVNQPIAIYRSQLPELDGSQFYWRDLIGLEVVLQHGEVFGTVSRMMATGANDVMVVREIAGAGAGAEHLIPFVMGVTIQQVDLEAKRISVDWERDF